MSRLLGLLLIGGALGAGPGPALAGEAWVRVDGGLVSATFDAVPAAEALEAILEASGVEIVVRPAVPERTLTLSVERLPLARFVQRVLVALDLAGFVLIENPGGAGGRVIAVDRARPGGAGPGGSVATPVPTTAPGSTPARVPSGPGPARPAGGAPTPTAPRPGR